MNLILPRGPRHATLSFFLAALLLVACSWLQAATRHHQVAAPDGVQLALQESGDPNGPPLILIHGLLGSHLNWDAQRADPALQRYRLISFDLRGHGLSGKPQGSAAYSEARRWADDLAAVIAATRGAGQSAASVKPVLVGWSLGAAVITNYLAAYGDDAIAGALYVDGVIEMGNPQQITAHPAVYRDLNAPELRTRLDARRAFLALCFHTPPGRATFERLLANAALASWDMTRAVFKMEVAAGAGLARMKAPLLLLYGGRDALVKAGPAIARARQLNPRATSILYAESGHAPFLEESQRFNRDLARFADAAQAGRGAAGGR